MALDPLGVEPGAEDGIDPGRPQRDLDRFDRRRVLVEGAAGRLTGGDLGEQLPGPLGGQGRAVGVDTALEAGRRLRPQAEALGGPEDAVAGEEGRFQQHFGGGVGHLGVAGPHDAGDGLRRPVGVADQEVGRRQRPLDAVERGDRLALAGHADDDAPAAEEVEVEGVQGLAPLEHHIVGDVDDIGDGAHSGLGQALRHPARRWGDGHSPGLGHVAGAAIERLDDQRCRREIDDTGGGRLRQGERQAESGGQVAGHAGDRHGVGPVGSDLEVEDDVVEAEHRAEVLAERRVGRQDHDPAVVVGQAELVGGAEHPVRELTTDPAPFELEAAGQLGPGRGPGDDVADDVVVGPADDPRRVAVAGVDVHQRQPVGVRVPLDRQHLHRADAGNVTPGGGDALHDEADLVQPVGQFGGLALDGGEVAKPGERGLHCRS
jgi:hypothetical protein